MQMKLWHRNVSGAFEKQARPGASFSKAPETFRARKAMAKSRTLRLQCCFIHIFYRWREVFLIQEVSGVYTSPFLDTGDLKMGFWARRLSRALEKQVPGPEYCKNHVRSGDRLLFRSFSLYFSMYEARKDQTRVQYEVIMLCFKYKLIHLSSTINLWPRAFTQTSGWILSSTSFCWLTYNHAHFSFRE